VVEHALKFSENMSRLPLLDITLSVERTSHPKIICKTVHFVYINGRDVQRKNVVNNVDKSSLWAP